MLLRFQWQTEKLGPELGLRPGFDSISPHNLRKSKLSPKICQKTGQKPKVN